MLSAGVLETNLRRYLKTKGISGVKENSTLGGMVKLLKKHDLLSQNGLKHFNDLAKKRNYLAHSLYDLFTHEIAETILPRTDLDNMDVEIFSERANTLASDFLHFAKMVARTQTNKQVLL